MRLSRILGERRRESAAHAESISHDLLVRAGYVRQHAAGIYSFLHLGLRSLRRIEAILRDEMDAIGAQEILMPFVHAADVWKSTGRYDTIDDTLVRFTDRRGHDMVLGMTHEEIAAQLAASELRSWRQTGIVVYQIQTKFRDEARPRGGLLRTREFLMKDAYSLDLDVAGLEANYERIAHAYARIFARTGLLDVHRVRSATGDMGGSRADEFMVLLEAGEDFVGLCDECGEGSNVEVLRSEGRCNACGSAVRRHRAVEVGNIFQLGTRYGEALGARVLDPHGRTVPLVMGSYGIGVSRLLAALVEQHHDERGIALPASVAPFDAHIVAIGDAQSIAHREATDAYTRLRAAGWAVLLDDRAARAGEKLADADLIGATLRITFGPSTGSGCAQISRRASGLSTVVAAADLAGALTRELRLPAIPT